MKNEKLRRLIEDEYTSKVKTLVESIDIDLNDDEYLERVKEIDNHYIDSQEGFDELVDRLRPDLSSEYSEEEINDAIEYGKQNYDVWADDTMADYFEERLNEEYEDFPIEDFIDFILNKVIDKCDEIEDQESQQILKDFLEDEQNYDELRKKIIENVNTSSEEYEDFITSVGGDISATLYEVLSELVENKDGVYSILSYIEEDFEDLIDEFNMSQEELQDELENEEDLLDEEESTESEDLDEEDLDEDEFDEEDEFEGREYLREPTNPEAIDPFDKLFDDSLDNLDFDDPDNESDDLEILEEE